MIIVDTNVLISFLVVIRIKSDASVNKFVLTALVSFEGLAPNLFLTIDKAILVTMVIEVYLADTTINMDDLFPVVRWSRAVIVLNKLELVWESTTKDQIIFSVLVVGSNFFDNQSLKIFIDCDTTNKTVYLWAFRIEINFALLVENRFFTIRA